MFIVENRKQQNRYISFGIKPAAFPGSFKRNHSWCRLPWFGNLLHSPVTTKTCGFQRYFSVDRTLNRRRQSKSGGQAIVSACRDGFPEAVRSDALQLMKTFHILMPGRKSSVTLPPLLQKKRLFYLLSLVNQVFPDGKQLLREAVHRYFTVAALPPRAGHRFQVFLIECKPS